MAVPSSDRLQVGSSTERSLATLVTAGLGRNRPRRSVDFVQSPPSPPGDNRLAAQPPISNTTPTEKEPIPMAKSPDEMLESMIRNLEEKTGRSLDAWVALARAQGLGRHGEIVKRLKGEHGLGHGYANLVAAKTLEAPGGAGGEDLVAAQYAGAKAALRPIYDTLAAAVASFGGDVEIAPKKTCVSFRRSKQFALVQPSTATRVDVGIQLKGVEPEGRLEASGSFNAMVSHRVRVGSAAEVDDRLLGWLRQAYERA
jgi:hypothetical protein